MPNYTIYTWDSQREIPEYGEIKVSYEGFIKNADNAIQTALNILIAEGSYGAMVFKGKGRIVLYALAKILKRTKDYYEVIRYD